jgi:hypothetical protein
MLVIFGATPKEKPLPAIPFTVITTDPLVVAGTGTTILVSDQLLGVAATPLNVTELAPWVAPKLVPLIVTLSPMPAAAGLML